MNRSSIGAMRHRFTIETPVRSTDNAGGMQELWISAGEVWGYLETAAGNETFAADKRSGRLTHAIVARQRAEFQPSHRLRLASRIFEIRAVTTEDDRRRRVRLLCEERDL